MVERGMPSRLTRSEFTQSLQNKKIDVREAAADPKLAGLDVARADLNRDGKISTPDEAVALFKEVDRFDRNGDSGSIALTTPSGSATRAAALVTALQSRAVFEVKDALR